MRTRASARVATQTDRIAGAHHLVFSHQMLRHMAVDGLQSVVMADHHIVAIATSFIVNYSDLSVEGGTDGITDIHLDVKSLVHTSPATAKLARDDAARSRHGKSAQVDAERIGQLRGAVCVLIAPFAV